MKAAEHMRPIVARYFDFLIQDFNFQKQEAWVSYEFHTRYQKDEIEVDVVWPHDRTSPWVNIWDTYGTSEEERVGEWDAYYLIHLDQEDRLRSASEPIDAELQYDEILRINAEILKSHIEILDGDLSAFPDLEDFAPVEVEVTDADGSTHVERYESFEEYTEATRARRIPYWRAFRSARSFWMSVAMAAAALAIAVSYLV